MIVSTQLVIPAPGDDNKKRSKQSKPNLHIVNEDCDFRTAPQLAPYRLSSNK